MKRADGIRGALLLLTAVALLSLLVVSVASCGSGDENAAETPQEGMDEGTRLPPGITSEDLEGLDLEDPQPGSGEDGEGAAEAEVADPEHTASLAGASFTVVDVARNDSNQKVIEASQREVMGDYLEIELAVENAGDELLDFSQYSFRLESPGIAADEYRPYYADNGYLGKYVSEHVISAVLLDYADLSPVLYKLKKKEVLEGVFLFFDLNPQSTEENADFSADIANGEAWLVIHKLRGSDSGEEVKINLSGFAD